MLNNDYLYVGLILKAHGISGAVCIKSYMSNPKDIFLYNPLYSQKKSFNLFFLRRTHNKLIATIETINDRTEAERLRGFKLYIPKKSLPKLKHKDEYYISNLIGLNVYLKDKSFVGNVERIGNIHSSTVIEISVKKNNNRIITLPFIKNFIISIDMQNGILIDIPKDF